MWQYAARISYTTRKALHWLYIKTNLKTHQKMFATVPPSVFSLNSGAIISPYTVELRRTESLRLVASILHIKILSISLSSLCVWLYFQYQTHPWVIIFDCFLYGCSYRLHCLQCFLSAYTVAINEIPVVALSAVTIAADRTTNINKFFDVIFCYRELILYRV